MMERQPLLFHLMLKQEFNWFTLASKVLKQKTFKIKVIITEMACDISPICDFLLGSLRTTLPTDTVDVELTVWMVKGIYMYRKDDIMEAMWSKKVTPFLSLRCKIQAYKDKQRQESPKMD